MAEKYYMYQKKKQYLQKQNYTYIEVWEHEWEDMKNEGPAIREFVDSLDIPDRLDAREAFFGGRTNATRLMYKADELKGERICYFDICSLYPTCQKFDRYMVGIPTVLNANFGSIDDYFGFVHCKVLPPRGLYHPMLPHRSNGKLTFPLCGTCVAER